MSSVSQDERFMWMAVEQALRGAALGEPPFGAVLVGAGGEVIAMAHDTVAGDRDMTSHAETMLVKKACRAVGPDLTGSTLYTTTEPCPMCFTSAWLARVSRVVFGCRMGEVAELTGGGQRELMVPVERMNEFGGDQLAVSGGVLHEACLGLFRLDQKTATTGAE